LFLINDEIVHQLVIKSCLKNSNGKTQYEIQSSMNICMHRIQICENITFLNSIFIQTDQLNRSKTYQIDLFGLVPFLKKNEQRTKQDQQKFTGSNIFLTENRSKPNRYTPNLDCINKFLTWIFYKWRLIFPSSFSSSNFIENLGLHLYPYCKSFTAEVSRKKGWSHNEHAENVLATNFWDRWSIFNTVLKPCTMVLTLVVMCSSSVRVMNSFYIWYLLWGAWPWYL